MWAQGVPLERDVLPDSCRASLVYQALRARDWFPDADLWHVSGELLALFDDITRYGIPLPDSYPVFLDQLERAYRARAGESLRFEARLVHELWYALSREDGPVDKAAAYALRLARLAEAAPMPLYAVGLAELTPAERVFFQRYAARQPVCTLGCDLPGEGGSEALPAGPVADLVQAAWRNPADDDVPLPRRAEVFRAAHPRSPLVGRLSLFGAASLEQEAHAAAAAVRAWLSEGKTAIAVIAQDRLVARRLRALLERSQILVEDETGWTLSTVAASSAVMRWLDALASRFHHLDLLDLLKSPLLFADRPAEDRRQGVYELEKLLRRHGVVSGLSRYRALAQAENRPEVLALLARLEQARSAFKTAPKPLSAWLQTLAGSLEILGLRQGLAQDPAGEQLLGLLDRLQRELSSDRAPFTLAEWRRWLNRQLEGATFRDTGIVSPVVFTHLSATRLRVFEGVVIAGGDAAHFPGRGAEGAFFNQAVRAQLGLPTFETCLRQAERDLAALLATAGEVLVTWQAQKNGEHNLMSPWFERLETFHRLAYGTSLSKDEGGRARQADLPERHGISSSPRPSLPPQLVPATISASGYNSLLACPYQFYARHALCLNELDEVRQALEKKDYGEYVHAILHRFHRRHPAIKGADRAMLERDLRAISEDVFAHALEADYLAHAWALRWEARIPAYLDWQAAREEAGWRWREGEVWRTAVLELEGSRSLTLKGRIDRVDVAEGGNGEAPGAVCAVLDYKTQSAETLKGKLQTPGEDAQLTTYALLLGAPVAQAAFVPVDGKDGIREVALPGEVSELCAAEKRRLRDLFTGIYRGAGLPAQGTAEVCGYCEMRGLCRKDYWE